MKKTAVGEPIVPGGFPAGLRRARGTRGPGMGALFLAALLMPLAFFSPFPFAGEVGERAYAANPPRVVLTFDDGYGLDHRILEFLSSQGISATAFVVGSWAQRNPDLLREMNALGWDVCNHTQNHPNLTRLPDAQILAELDTCQSVIGSLTGQYLPVFRPPGGFIDARVQAVAAAAGYTPVMWDLDSGDARGTEYPVPQRVGFMVNAARDGSMILFHFGGSHTYELVTGVVQGLQKRGFCFVTLSELYGWKRLVRGGDTVPGVRVPSRQHYFAEGTTRPGFEEWLAIFNPGEREVGVKATFYSSGGELSREYRVPAQRRITLNVNHEFPAQDDVAVHLEASGEVVAERALYFNLGNGLSGGFLSTSVPEPRTLSYFPEGTVREDFQEYLALFNPGQAEATVELNFKGDQGGGEHKVSVPSRRRITLGLNGLAPAGEHALVVRSSVPLVAERSVYYLYENQVAGGSCTPGEPAPCTRWFFAEGTTREFFQSYLSIYNPCREPSWVRVCLDMPDGSCAQEEMVVEAGERKTLFLNSYLPPEADYSTRVESLLPVLAERSLYFRKLNFSGGTCSVGISDAAEEWYFAEGCTAPGCSEWLAVYNPWEGEQVAEVTYYVGAETVERSYLLPSRGRATIDVSAEVGQALEVSVRVRAPRGVVTERSVYFERSLP